VIQHNTEWSGSVLFFLTFHIFIQNIIRGDLRDEWSARQHDEVISPAGGDSRSQQTTTHHRAIYTPEQQQQPPAGRSIVNTRFSPWLFGFGAMQCSAVQCSAVQWGEGVGCWVLGDSPAQRYWVRSPRCPPCYLYSLLHLLYLAAAN